MNCLDNHPNKDNILAVIDHSRRHTLEWTYAFQGCDVHENDMDTAWRYVYTNLAEMGTSFLYEITGRGKNDASLAAYMVAVGMAFSNIDYSTDCTYEELVVLGKLGNHCAMLVSIYLYAKELVDKKLQQVS